ALVGGVGGNAGDELQVLRRPAKAMAMGRALGALGEHLQRAQRIRRRDQREGGGTRWALRWPVFTCRLRELAQCIDTSRRAESSGTEDRRVQQPAVGAGTVQNAGLR